MLWHAILNPLVILLGVLSVVSFATGDPRAGAMMLCMILLSVGLKLVQESRADSAAAKLKAMISVTRGRARCRRTPAQLEAQVTALTKQVAELLELVTAPCCRQTKSTRSSTCTPRTARAAQASGRRSPIHPNHCNQIHGHHPGE